MGDFLHKNGILKMKKLSIALLTIVAILLLVRCGGEGNAKDVAEKNNSKTAPVAQVKLSEQAGGDTKKQDTKQDTKPISSLSEAIDRLVAEGKYPKLNRDRDVAGPDVDGNGVRDDLDAYVASLPDTEEQKKAMLQGFKLYRYNVTADPSNIKDVERGMVLSARAVACIIDIYGPREGHKKLSEVKAYSLNTKYRFEAYVLFDQAKNGMSVRLDPNSCDE